MTALKIAVLEGDGIGPEVMAEAIKVLKIVEKRTACTFEFKTAAFGAQAYFDHGFSFPEETKKICDECDAILKGPIGLSHEDSKKIPVDMQPERGALLPLRRRYNTYANVRLAKLPRDLSDCSPLNKNRNQHGIDLLIVREFVSGPYFGDQHTGVNHDGLRYVRHAFEYDEKQVQRVVIRAFEFAMKRKRRLHNIQMSNVMKSSVLWNAILEEVHREFPEVEVINMLADTAAYSLPLNPSEFDVLVMENIFGDVISNLCAGIIGSLGLMPTACLGSGKSCFEPAHGSAPDLAGLGIANPFAMIGSAAMMLDYNFGMKVESENIFNAMTNVLRKGGVTQDLTTSITPRLRIDTVAFGDLVAEELSSMPMLADA